MGAQRLARLAVWTAGTSGAVAAAYLGLVSGALPVDAGVGRRTRALGPRTVDITAPRDAVFDVDPRDTHSRTASPVLLACCAAAYSADVVALLLGDAYHPGGTVLTRRLADGLRLAEDCRVSMWPRAAAPPHSSSPTSTEYGWTGWTTPRPTPPSPKEPPWPRDSAKRRHGPGRGPAVLAAARAAVAAGTLGYALLIAEKSP